MSNPYLEADYCLRAMDAGFKVKINPKLIVYKEKEYESSLVGVEKKLDHSINLEKKQFIEKHKEYLNVRPSVKNFHELAFFDKLKFSAYKKRILFIDTSLPNSGRGGAISRSKYVVDRLLRDECFITYISTEKDKKLNTNEHKYFIDKNSIEFIETSSQDAILLTLSYRRNFYDLVIVSGNSNFDFYEKSIKILLGDHKTVFCVDKLTSLALYLEKSERSLLEIDYDFYLESDEYLSEAEILSKADFLWFASQLESIIFNNKSNFKSIPIYEVGYSKIKLKNLRQPSYETSSGIAFMCDVVDSKLSNNDTINYLLTVLLPLLRQSRLASEIFHIIGYVQDAITVSKIQKYCTQDSFTIFHGDIDFPECILVNVRLFVAPTRISSGIPHSISIPCQLGIPIVVSKLLAQQIFYGAEYFSVCGSADEFINSLSNIYSSKSEWKRYSQLSTVYADKYLDSHRYENAFENLLNQNYSN
jgi:hypothetical protein